MHRSRHAEVTEPNLRKPIPTPLAFTTSAPVDKLGEAEGVSIMLLNRFIGTDATCRVRLK
jgi:hypothetical protein